MEKEKYLENLQKVSEIVQKDLAGSTKLNRQIDDLCKQIKDFRVKVLCIGEFSAGKSAMFNSFFNISLLKEDILPETAIATELCYGENEHAELVGLDGKVKECSFEDVNKYDAKDYLKYTYFINNKKLAIYNEYCFVDMPGFNSGVEAHNKSLLQYIGEASSYILAVDAAAGGLSASMIHFIQEIQHYSNHIAIVITKCDKRTKSDIAQVQSEIESELTSLLGYTPMIMTTSIREQINLIDSVDQIIHSFSAKELFREKFDPIYKELLQSTYLMLQEKEKSTELDTYAIDEKIRIKETLKEKLVQEIKIKKVQLHEQLQTIAKNGILGELSIKLNSHADELAEAASVSQGAFNHTVNNIIRPVLVESSEKYIGNSIEKFIGELDFKQYIQGESSDSTQETEAVIERALKTCKKIGEVASSKELKNAKGLYRAVIAGISIATEVVAPWIEIILLVLPDILSFFNEGGRKEERKSTILSTVIPEIISKLRVEITKTLQDVEKEMAETLENKITAQIDREKEALSQLKQEKETKEKNMAELKTGWQQDMSLLQVIQNVQ